MTRILTIGLLALAASAQAQPPGRGGPPNWRFVGPESSRPGPVVKNAPFSADVTTETTIVLADGNHIRQTSSMHLYRDGEGRTRREQSLNSIGGLSSNTNLPPVVFINDPVAGTNYALSPTSKTGTRSGAMPGGRPAPPTGPVGMNHRMPPDLAGQANRKMESLGRQSVEGLAADGTRITLTVPAGQMGNERPMQTVVETWYSPDLQTVVLSKRNDPRSGETITRYTNISRTEPPHQLFEPPADFKISDAGGRGPRGGR